MFGHGVWDYYRKIINALACYENFFWFFLDLQCTIIMHTDVWHNKERYYCFKNYKKQGRYVQNQQKKSSSNINTLSNDPTSIIIYRKRRYEHVYDYNKVFHEF